MGGNAGYGSGKRGRGKPRFPGCEEGEFMDKAELIQMETAMTSQNDFRKMAESCRAALNQLAEQFRVLGIGEQIDFAKFYLYALVTHSTAIEGSTVTERENALMFDDGILPAGRNLTEQLMNLDLKKAYEQAFALLATGRELTVQDLQALSAAVMKNTGSQYNTILGSFDASAGDLRLVNVSAGRGGKSYLSWQKVPAALARFCDWLCEARRSAVTLDVAGQYEMTFEAHYRLVQIHPWADGNGRVSRLLMNALQHERSLLPTIVQREHRERYIEALEAAGQMGDSQPFLDFMGSEMAAYYRTCIAEYQTSMAKEE